MQIAGLKLDSPFILAPLAGYTDLAFRILCREYGAGLCYSEMISCHGLVFGQKKTLQMMESDQSERPVAMQLFGSEPDIMGEAAAILAEQPIDLIDINMGCPVRKVIKKGAGAALMRNPQRAESIIRKVCDNSKLPVTVKIRTGWNHHTIIAPEFAKMAEQAGAAAIALHARTWTDGFSGATDWQVLAATKRAVSIPVIGNGDIHSHAAGVKMMQETGCDGVMIGRATLGRPWIFEPLSPATPSLNYRLQALKRHLQLIDLHQQATSPAKIKNHAAKYFKGVPASTAIRQKIFAAAGLPELHDILDDIGSR